MVYAYFTDYRLLPYSVCSFVKYCPDKVFKIDPVTDNVVVDDPLLATEFNDQMVGRKVADTGRRVMEFGTSRFINRGRMPALMPSPLQSPRSLQAGAHILRHLDMSTVTVKWKPSFHFRVETTGCLLPNQIVQIALRNLKAKLSTVSHALTSLAALQDAAAPGEENGGETERDADVQFEPWP